MFVALGISATGLGQTLQENRAVLREVSGIVIAALGVFFIATLFIPAFNREFRSETLLRKAASGGPIIAGLAFAVAWLPCTGPTLGVILTAAGNQDTVGKGAVLLAFYSLGLAVPFLLCALAMASMTRFFKLFRNHFRTITFVAGGILIAMGWLLYTNDLTQLNTWANDLGLNLIGNL
jgi:cytochrome c-type biogenesis protein